MKLKIEQHDDRLIQTHVIEVSGPEQYGGHIAMLQDTRGMEALAASVFENEDVLTISMRAARMRLSVTKDGEDKMEITGDEVAP
jgi:hypothetical protein